MERKRLIYEEEEISIRSNLGNDYLNKKQILFKLRKINFLLNKFYFLNFNYNCYFNDYNEITELFINIYIKILLYIIYILFKKIKIFKIL